MRPNPILGIAILVLLAGLLPRSNMHEGITQDAYAGISFQQPAPTPTVDRLALPVLPEHPTQVELGSSLYYYHCMPCHGDQGQGLTDEWREVWEEDHQNCWASGCHGIRDQDEVFTIPTTIPPVSGTTNLLKRFSKPNDLYEYLRETHPPQTPGILKDDEYWALTAYLLAKNGRMTPEGEIGPLAENRIWGRVVSIVVCILGSALAALLVMVVRKRRKAGLLA